METLLNLLPLAIIGGIYLSYQRKNRHSFGPVSFIIMSYVVMLVLSVILGIMGKTASTYELELIPILFISFCLAISFWGFHPYKDYRVLALRIENLPLFNLVEKGMLVLSALSIVYFSPFAIAALSGDIKANRENLRLISESLGSWGMFNSLCTLVANMFVLNIVCAFVNLCPAFSVRRFSKLKALCLLLSSTSYIVYVLAYVGRDGFIYWVMTFVFVYLLFKDFIAIESRMVIRRLAFLIGLLAFVPFSAITYHRFSDAEEEMLVSVLQYGGMQIHHFNDQFLAFSEPQWGRINFPVVYDLSTNVFGDGPGEFDRYEWFRLYTVLDVIPWMFSTWVGALVFDFGYYVTPLVILLIAVMSRLSLRGIATEGVLSISQLLILLICAQVVLYGVFYFRQYSTNYYLLVMMVLSGMFHLGSSRNSSLLLLRADSQKDLSRKAWQG